MNGSKQISQPLDEAIKQMAVSFEEEARSYEPESSPKFVQLLPFKDGITILRRRGPSYRVITERLPNKDVDSTSINHDKLTGRLLNGWKTSGY